MTTDTPTQVDLAQSPIGPHAITASLTHGELALWISQPATVEIKWWIDNEEICTTFANGEQVITVRFTSDFKIVQI